ncbi:MAG: two-component regulator propeller domain-containing protein [Saprospiraceae bacterium]
MVIRLLLFFSFLSASFYLKAQALQPVYQQFTEQDGLPSNYLNCLFQDSQGFIWIGSDKGLTRFDGVNFKTYTTDDGLSGNMVLDIKEDELGQLWIGTFERGLCRFDGKAFECFGKKYGVSTASTLLILDEKTILYSEGTGNLAQFNIEKKQSKQLLDISLDGISNAIIPASNNQIIFPCGNQIFRISDGEKVEEMFFKKYKNIFFIKKGVTTSDGKTWLLDSHNEVLLQVEIIASKIEIIEILPAINFNADLLGLDDCFIANYIKNNTYQFIDKKRKVVRQFKNPHAGQNVDILLGKEKQLWLATVGYGLFVQKGYPYLYQLPQQNGATYDIEILENGDVVVGGDKGIWLYNNELKLLGYQSKIKQVRSVEMLDGIGISAGTLSGYTYFFKDEKSLLNIAPKYNLVVSSGVSGIVSTQSDAAIFSSYGAGLRLFSNQKLSDIDLFALPNLMVEGLFKTTQGIWATSSSDGVLLMSKNENRLFSKRTGLISNNVYTVFEATPDSIWIGTENGATLWNGKQKTTNYPTVDDLESKRFTAFFKDKNQQLWAFSDKYLYTWKHERWQAVKSLTFQKIPEGRVYDVAYDSDFHRVFVASTTGAFVLDLEKMEPMTAPINFVLESVESKFWVLDTQKINILDAENNSIRVSFSLPSYTRSTNNSCYFRFLEDGDSWTKATEPSSFQIENLSSGNYILQVMTANPNGVVGDIQTIAKFKILPPVWLRWWAIILEILLGVALVGGIVAWYFRRKNKQRLAALKIERELQIERERISRDLHDNIGAQLTNITYKLDLAAHQSKNEKDIQVIGNVSDDTRNTMKLLRDTIWALQKKEFSINDLANKLQAYVARLEGIDVKFQVKKNIKNDWMISSKEVLHLFRIIQEAIQNIIKHAEASQADIIFRVKNQQLEILILDNGKGLELKNEVGISNYGLENMAFRANEIGAKFFIEKNKPQGTCIKILKSKIGESPDKISI